MVSPPWTWVRYGALSTGRSALITHLLATKPGASHPGLPYSTDPRPAAGGSRHPLLLLRGRGVLRLLLGQVAGLDDGDGLRGHVLVERGLHVARLHRPELLVQLRLVGERAADEQRPGQLGGQRPVV